MKALGLVLSGVRTQSCLRFEAVWGCPRRPSRVGTSAQVPDLPAEGRAAPFPRKGWEMVTSQPTAQAEREPFRSPCVVVPPEVPLAEMRSSVTRAPGLGWGRGRLHLHADRVAWPVPPPRDHPALSPGMLRDPQGAHGQLAVPDVCPGCPAEVPALPQARRSLEAH